MQSVTLIIDKRLELSTKYKKLLETSSNQVIISRDLLTSIKIIQDTEPDLIIISDSFDESLSNFCKQVRALAYNMRPIIVALSKSADTNDKINTLNSGADDFLSEPVNPNEFKVRINAHLRRELESNIDSKQLLPNKNYTMRSIKRVINSNYNMAMLYIKIANFDAYKKAYTELASDKLLQTYSAIIKASLGENDYAGKLEEDEFFIITDSIKTENIARFLTFAFDSVIDKFYAQHDLNRGYMIIQGDDFAGKRANFIHFTISAIINDSNKYKNATQILNTLSQLNVMADLPNQSNYLIDRPKISGQNSIIQKTYNNKVFIYETDEALKTLLQTILKLQGYETEIANSYKLPPKNNIPALIILDAEDSKNNKGLNLCVTLKNNDLYKNTKIIVTSITHNKELVLNTGADLYLPKPYDVSTLIKWVDNLILEYNQ